MDQIRDGRGGMAGTLAFRLTLRYVAEWEPTAGLSYTGSYTLHFLDARMINRVPVPRRANSPRKNDVIRPSAFSASNLDTCVPDSNRLLTPSNPPNRHNRSTGQYRRSLGFANFLKHRSDFSPNRYERLAVLILS